MRTVNQIIDELGTIALDHRFINSFKEGEMSEVDIQKLAGNKYPICYADISGATIEKGVLTYSLDILVMDMILPGQTDAQEQYSDTLRTLIDIVSQYAQVLSAQSDVELFQGGEGSKLSEKYGWFATFVHLAGEDITKLPQVERTHLETALAWLAYEQDRALLEKQKLNL